MIATGRFIIIVVPTWAITLAAWLFVAYVAVRWRLQYWTKWLAKAQEEHGPIVEVRRWL